MSGRSDDDLREEETRRAEAVAALKVLWLIPVDLVLVPESVSSESFIESVIRIFKFEGPGSSGRPGVAGENATDESDSLFPVFKIVCCSMEADDPFSSIDEIENRGALGFVRHEVGRAVENDRIILSEVFLREHFVFVCKIDVESLCFLSDGLHRVISEWNRSVNESLTTIENEHLPL